jgi:C_GCAxxG_C_C family probable redox protein
MQSTRVLRALATFEEGFNCAQAVLSAFGPDLGLEESMSLRAAQSFGGGIAHRGELCGALSGALIALGLRYGKTEGADDASRDRTYAKAAELLTRFEERFGSCHCRTLIGYDLTDPAQYAMAKESAVFRETCPRFVTEAAALLETLL